ncbi:MAG TPA: hypothetical protein VJ813_11350 [Vicinamibacterales bacterium]|nr:hypothetical protein [Vicinamibacterales bacterium]
MHVRQRFTLGLSLILALLAATVVPIPAQSGAQAGQPGGQIVDAVRFREIGPTRQGGRYVDFAVVETNPRVFYAATATGGLWKTVNNGISFTPVFDGQPDFALGAVALAPSRPDVIYLGTGEANNSRSTYDGNGVYKSVDGGQKWTKAGLPNAGRIGRIVVHPKNPDVVLVAASGRLYSENPDRGLYRSTDGGSTWTKTLDHKVDGRPIGAIDIAMDPSNPNTLYASTYDKVRKPWTFGEGGPGSAIFKSTDGGVTWRQLTTGLPTGMIGRIGISIARNAPKTVYAVIENANARDPKVSPEERRKRLAQGFGDGSIGDELYRSDDAGATWRKVAPPVAPTTPAEQSGERGEAPAQGGRGAAPAQGGGRGGRGGWTGGNPPYWYGQVRVDPNDREHVYLLSVGVTHTTDGGKTWSSPFGFGGDNHAMWINPADSDHLILGHDHGMGVSFDRGRTWLSPDNKPLAQFYAIGYDMERPYNVYGGLQDNGSQRGPSTMKGGGSIPFEAWYRVGGGDGFYNVVDPTDSRWLYNESQFGNIQRMDQQTGQSRSIRYSRPQGQEPLRWNWSSPILLSPHNPEVVYHAANVLLRSANRGDTWTEISPDLTKNLPERRNGSGNIQYATITTIDESPIVAGVMWAGTDDGNVQVTRDGGKTWTNVADKIPGHPGYWVSRVIASHHEAAAAYVTVTGYRHDDFKPFVWKTTDYGATWTSIAGNLPNEAINVVREDRTHPGLLFVGTDFGVHASLDGGKAWHRMKNGITTNPVHDLAIHPREQELIVGTHGRGIFIADVSGLQGLTPAALSGDGHLAPIVPTVQHVTGLRPVTASLNYNGQSRQPGVHINYYLKSAATGATVRVYDGARLIAETPAPGNAGLNTVRWTMQSARAMTEAEQAAARGRGGRGRGGFGGGRGGAGGSGSPQFPAAAENTVLATVPPGQYRVVLSVGGRELDAQTALVMAER